MHLGKNGKMTGHLQIIEQAYRGKKVFLTGHTGFKGAWLLMWLHILGAEVKGYALSPENEDDLFNLIEGQKLCDSVIGDLRDKDKLRQSINSFQPDFIIHFAAQSLVRLSYEVPVDTFEVNALGTANVLDAVRALDKPCAVILITTDKVYYNYEWTYPYRETDRLGGYDPYSASKACAELIIDSYRNSFFNTGNFKTHQKAIAVARAGNVIGGGDWAKNRLLPDIAMALGRGQKISIRNPHAVRPWQHVLEPLSGYLLLGARLFQTPLQFCQAYNFGPESNDSLTVEQMVKMAISSWAGGEYEITTLADQRHEAGLLKLDISKARAELEWAPKMNALEAVALTIKWYKAFYENRELVRELTRDQIMTYSKL
ncbi:CDP-glucose 4,6-dehydratase [Ohtaekwangia sp.]|uniref:CDP-glucose 4,6-dehydratase n=1 Tax=Ohtaekwangia sp. TaxID=2066019 RepID=UPI002FDD9FC2